MLSIYAVTKWRFYIRKKNGLITFKNFKSNAIFVTIEPIYEWMKASIACEVLEPSCNIHDVIQTL